VDNGTSERVVGFFDEMARLPARWGHNEHYRKRMLRLAGRRKRALDLGCGTGELTRALALRCSEVVGVDASSGMIEAARSRNWGLNIEYEVADAAAYLEGRMDEFDLIVSVAAFHHMDEERMLSLCSSALRPGGMLLVLDIYKARNAADYAVSALGMALSPFLHLCRTGRARQEDSEREAWSRHRPDDSYHVLEDIRRMARTALGDCEVRRTIFWRYLLVHEKMRPH
jgi:2-polyprenyl-3-methyl-5-hydroxy-6-metoxy-1,4-benzoquinol methylase